KKGEISMTHPRTPPSTPSPRARRRADTLRPDRLACCVLAALLPMAAAAATDPTPAPEPAIQAEGQAAPSAQAAQSEVVQLDEIVVTARRRTERAQDVPIALSVLDGDDVEAFGGPPNLQEI